MIYFHIKNSILWRKKKLDKAISQPQYTTNDILRECQKVQEVECRNQGGKQSHKLDSQKREEEMNSVIWYSLEVKEWLNKNTCGSTTEVCGLTKLYHFNPLEVSFLTSKFPVHHSVMLRYLGQIKFKCMFSQTWLRPAFDEECVEEEEDLRVLKLWRPGKDKASRRVMGAQDESCLGCFASDYLGSGERVPLLIYSVGSGLHNTLR